MVIFKRKNIVIFWRIIILIMFVYEILCLIKVKNQENIMEVIATPISNKVIILDAGHGLPDRGAESNTKIAESEINLKIVLKIQKLLEQTGSTVLLTRSDENGIYEKNCNTIREKKVNDIKKRVEIGNQSSADIFVSIHLNKGDSEKYKGFQVFYKENDESKKLAKNITNELKNNLKESGRESMKIKNKYIIDHVEIPITIVECGFLSNYEESQLLNTNEYQDKLAWAIYLGIIEYFYN